MTETITILHVFGKMNRGGAEIRTVELLNHVDPNKFAMHFCSLSVGEGDLDAQIRLMGSDVTVCPLGIDFFRSFRSVLRMIRPQVVHSHVHYLSGLIIRIAKLEGIPVRIAHFRSTADGRPSGFVRMLQRRMMKHWIATNATNILAVSDASMFAAWSPGYAQDPRCQVVYNGLDLVNYAEMLAKGHSIRNDLGIENSCMMVVHVGRMVTPKNHLRIIDIFSSLRRIRQDSVLVLVGDDKTVRGAEVHEMCRTYSLGNSVRILGKRTDVASIVAQSNVLLFPSLWEGLPGAVLEACALGIPVVASDIAPVEEIEKCFPHLVTTRSLSQSSDDDWARALVEKHRPELPNLADIRTSLGNFETTPFAMKNCVDALSGIWSSKKEDYR